MSILDRLTNRHLDDAALAELWTVAASDTQGVTAEPHLQHCAECRVRFSAFATWMEDIRDEAVAEAEAAFPAERLAAQQAQIFRRIEAAERPARVIVFPKFPADSTPRHSPVHRWVAAAAAAGLLVGLGLGQLMDLRHLGERGPVVAQSQGTDAPSRGIVPASATISVETMFQELEAAATPQYDSLRPFDTFTPRAADFITSSR